MTLEELNIKFTASMGGLQTQLNGLKNQLGGINVAAAKTQNAFAGIAKAAKMFLGLAAVRALYQVGKSSLAMANEVVESENLFAESMRGMAGAAREWSDGLRDSLGLNAYALRKNVGVFNVMFRSMGMGTQKAYEMSTVLTELAEDMASFYNLPSEEAFTKLRAGITGETEPLKRLGILVDENTTKQYAYANGIAKVGEELTQQEKLLARYGSILAQTTTAQGDLARTLDSPVNQIRLLNNTLDQARVALGQAFQPIQSAIIPILNSIASAALFAARAVSAFVNAISRLSTVNVFAGLVAGKTATKQGELADNIDRTSEAMKGGGKAAKTAAREIKQAAKDANVGLKSFDEINKLTLETAEALEESSGGGKGGSGSGVAEIEVPDTGEAEGYATALEVISRKVREAAAAIKAFWDGLRDSLIAKVVGTAWETLKWVWESVIKPIGDWAIRNPRTIGDMLGAIAIAIGSFKIATGLVTFLTNMKGALLGLGGASVTYPGLAGWVQKVGIAIRAHPGIAIAAGVAAGIALIVNSISNSIKDRDAENLAERFGTLALSMEELQYIASRVKTPFLNAMGKLSGEYAALQAAADKLEQLAFDSSKIIFAYTLEPGPLDDDQKSLLVGKINDLVTTAVKGINDAKLVSLQGIELAFGGTDSEGTASEVFKITSENWEIIEAEAQRLGEELNKKITEALLDDTITPEERTAILEYQNKLAKIAIEAMDIDAALAEVNLHNIRVGFKGQPTLTAQSTKDFAEALNTALDEQVAAISGSMEKQLALDIVLARKAGEIQGLSPAEIDAEIETLKAAYDAQKQTHILDARMQMGEVYFEGVAQQVGAAYSRELAATQNVTDILSSDWIGKAAEKLFGPGWKTALKTASPQVKDDIALEASMMMQEALAGVDLPTAEAQRNVAALLKMMEPTTSQWAQMAADMTARGEEVPQWLKDGLLMVSGLDALTQASKEVDNAVLRGFKVQDVDKYNTEGGRRTQAYADGVKSKADDAKAAAQTVENAAYAGFGGGSGLYSTGSNFVQGFIDGLKSKYDAVGQVASKLAGRVKDAMKNTLEVQSPSRIAFGIGGYVGEGLALGMESMTRKVYATSERLAQEASHGLQGIGSAIGGNISGTVDIDSSGQTGSIVQQAVEAVMDRLNFQLYVDGEQFGRVAVRTINDTQRRAGQYLLGMG